ncbi:hypothetical protein A2767_00645 [Candidatus Roizmanbacteria bacterium RIFCSPHIGHO2_01_FULL_35_10]|uniref:PIN domain-containing protein n=1 Tax=Candidatus Roizmanbacteria bacterium RIFCSPLOWO2_01_FULL_35_13 TaxID=1802055 RepID=A0A1F7I908_9BACT|nr:MAG: hypothetical protein A2767_00645 [Candidatus Roizmanbacteria bacterium RIFCSPHIGHO2_01_FULL_35_10]OGK39847.1 MAG: hypothetical protein A3A74_03070 [Candidatus Roizmanbacteria bacterium RIFCSPLOWO2_01_FULL_35_13]
MMKKVFFDSSVLFSAVNSPTGGSAKLFTLTNIKKIVSKVVLTEVERNVRNKLLNYHLDRFFLLVEKLEIVDLPIDKGLVKKTEEIIVKKDAVILMQAKKAKPDFLVTLDKKHFLQEKVINFMQPAKVLTPKDLLQIIERKI